MLLSNNPNVIIRVQSLYYIIINIMGPARLKNVSIHFYLPQIMQQINWHLRGSHHYTTTTTRNQNAFKTIKSTTCDNVYFSQE